MGMNAKLLISYVQGMNEKLLTSYVQEHERLKLYHQRKMKNYTISYYNQQM